jgi:hypothetical protein
MRGSIERFLQSCDESAIPHKPSSCTGEDSRNRLQRDPERSSALIGDADFPTMPWNPWTLLKSRNRLAAYGAEFNSRCAIPGIPTKRQPSLTNGPGTHPHRLPKLRPCRKSKGKPFTSRPREVEISSGWKMS